MTACARENNGSVCAATFRLGDLITRFVLGLALPILSCFPRRHARTRIYRLVVLGDYRSRPRGDDRTAAGRLLKLEVSTLQFNLPFESQKLRTANRLARSSKPKTELLGFREHAIKDLHVF